jgi:hypothetical protein
VITHEESWNDCLAYKERKKERKKEREGKN